MAPKPHCLGGLQIECRDPEETCLCSRGAQAWELSGGQAYMASRKRLRCRRPNLTCCLAASRILIVLYDLTHAVVDALV